MEVNNNPNHVIMSREVYDELIGLAEVGASELCRDLRSISRHVRKFNIDQKEAHKHQLIAARMHLTETIKLAKELLRQAAGKTVYWSVNGDVVAAGRLLSNCKGHKTVLRVKDLMDNKIRLINVHSIILSAPDHVLQIDDYWERALRQTKTLD